MTTYGLFYDGVVSADVISRHSDTAPSNKSITFPNSLVVDLSKNIALDILKTYASVKGAGGSALSSTIKDEDQRCRESAHGGGRCTVDHVSKEEDEVELHVTTHIYPYGIDGAVRLDVALTAPDTKVVREALVQSVSKINGQLLVDSDDSVWSITQRPNAFEMRKTWDALSSVTATQQNRETRAGSLENMILGNSEMRNRTLITSIDPTGLPRAIWQYDDVDFKDPVRALFIDGQLQAITSPANAAHAEALVHPAMIAHPRPVTVAVISLTPTAIVKEVLKHKSVEDVFVIGADEVAFDMVEEYMSILDDCSFLKKAESSCMEQDAVEYIEQDIQEWLSSYLKGIKKNETTVEFFDIILVDVPIGTKNWLSLDFIGDLNELLEDENSIIVVSSGSLPSLFGVDTETELTARETLIREAARLNESDETHFDVMHVYDEVRTTGSKAFLLMVEAPHTLYSLFHIQPLASPLSSVFITFFQDNESENFMPSYSRFVRKNSASIDLDMVARFHPPVAGGRFTMVYDGPTHVRYMIPSRAWENWYCNTLPGRNFPICKDFLYQWSDATYHHYGTEVRKHPVKGRGVFATEDIPEGHFLLPHDIAMSLRLEREQLQALKQFVVDFPDAEMYHQLLDYLIAYGFEMEGLGFSGWGVSLACNNTFMNHACTKEDKNIQWLETADVTEAKDSDLVFSPVYVRRTEVMNQLSVTTRDIKAGDELTCDYKGFRANEKDEEFNKFLNTICTEGIGLVPVVDPEADGKGESVAVNDSHHAECKDEL